MTIRSLRYLVALSCLFGMLATTSCQTNKSRDKVAAASKREGAFKKSLYARPKVDRRKDGARINPLVLSQSNRANTRLVIDIERQRGYLLVNEKVAVETPVSTGRPGKPSPRGTFSMTQRVRRGKVSTIYGVEMPYWMRLGGSVYGVHAGYLPGYPASAGCIRLPMSAAEVIFENTSPGTKVSIYNKWNDA